MRELSAPDSVDRLYASWGEAPSQARPLMQGDVFSGVTLPGLSPEPQTAQIVMHPCNMRMGITLRPRITMIPVNQYSMQPSDWRRRFRIMPLPELLGPGEPNFMADMTDFVSVASGDLQPEMRVASLSNEGVLLLQQRLVFTQTRLLLDLDRFHEQMAPTFTELELQEEWAEEALAATSQDATEVAGVVDAAAKQYQDWLDEDDQARRRALQQVREHSRIRREARQHYLALYEPS